MKSLLSFAGVYTEIDAHLAAKVASMSVQERAARVVEIANSLGFDDAAMLEFAKLLMGPTATVAAE